MKLEEAQGTIRGLRGSRTFNQMNHLGLAFVVNAAEILDDRITELEVQRDELVEALLGFALKTDYRTSSLTREWLQAIKLISSIKGKPWEEIEASNKENKG